MSDKKEYATINANDKYVLIIGTNCSRDYCQTYGCDFPNCATLSDEEFNTEEEIKSKFPNLTIV